MEKAKNLLRQNIMAFIAVTTEVENAYQLQQIMGTFNR